jgi:hypothetical protein
MKKRSNKVGELGMETETETVMTPRKLRINQKKINFNSSNAAPKKHPSLRKGPERRDSVDSRKVNYLAQQMRGGGVSNDGQNPPSHRNYDGENQWITELLREREQDKEMIQVLASKLEEQQNKLKFMADGIESMDNDASSMIRLDSESDLMSSNNY